MYFGSFDCPIGAWVHQYAGMQNPMLTGPLFRLLVASWQQSPTGTVPDDNEWLARICAMPIAQFAQVKEELLGGFSRHGIRWTVPELVAKAEQLDEFHGEGFSRLSAAATAVVLEPEHFALQTEEQEKSVKKRKKRLPPGFSITSQMAVWGINTVREHALKNGASRVPTDSEAMAVMHRMLEMFKQHAQAKDWMYQDWDQALQLFTGNQFNGTYGRISTYLPELFPTIVTPMVGLGGMAPSAGKRFVPTSRRDRIVENNDAALAEITNLIQGRAAPAVNDFDTFDMPLMRRAQ